MFAGAKQRTKDGHIAAPFGLNVVAPASAVPETDGLILLNLVAGDRGLKPRPGWKEHAINVGTSTTEVRSIIPFHGSQAAKNQLFAATTDKIYKVTAGGPGAHTAAYTFGTANALSGFGVWTGFTTIAEHFLAFTDETNGYVLYTESTDSWAPGSVSNVSPADLTFVMQWKTRLWFIERNTSKAWYLPVGAIAGACTAFDFGPLFRTGGYLVGLWSWTVDGGAGMDDFLVAISSTGDVVVFAGTDPSSSSTFQQLGEWNTGGVPAGRRIATQFGGDILILTLLGILPLSKLVGGQLVTPDTYETYKIRPLFNDVIGTQQNLLGWEMLIHPQDNFLLLNTPGTPGEPQEQFAMSYATRGWSELQGQPIFSAGIWQSEMYFGTKDGRVCKSTGFLDNVGWDNSTANAKPVESVCLTGFRTMDNPNKKMVRVLRPMFVTHGANPSAKAFARYDFDTQPIFGSVPVATPGPNTWDLALWDVGVFASRYGTYKVVQCPTGIGSAIAVGVQLNTQDYCVLVGFDMAEEEGGML